MNRSALLKNLLLGFLPLLMFVGAEEFFSASYPEEVATRYALLLAMTMGIGQALYILITEKRLDKMVLMDTGLILLLGGVSLLSGNDIFFKVKPALVQFIMVVLMAVAAFLKPQLLLAMSGRMMQGIELQEGQLKAMQRSAQGLVILLALHTGLIVYAAFYMSKTDWAFISGPLIYILAGLYFVGMLALAKWKARTQSKQLPGERVSRD